MASIQAPAWVLLLWLFFKKRQVAMEGKAILFRKVDLLSLLTSWSLVFWSHRADRVVVFLKGVCENGYWDVCVRKHLLKR